MSDLKGAGGIVRATVQVKRAATGLVETYDLVGCTDPAKLPQLIAEARRTREHGTAGAMTGPGSDLTNEPKES